MYNKNNKLFRSRFKWQERKLIKELRDPKDVNEVGDVLKDLLGPVI